jgi:hypothetical protein
VDHQAFRVSEAVGVHLSSPIFPDYRIMVGKPFMDTDILIVIDRSTQTVAGLCQS